MSDLTDVQSWGLYLLAAVLTFLAWHRVTARIPWMTLRDLLRVVALAALFTPAPLPGYAGHFAPAWLVVLFDGVLQHSGDPLPAATVLLIVLVVLLALIAAWRYFRAGGNQGLASDG